MFALPVLVGVPLLVGLGLRTLPPSLEANGPVTHTIRRGTFVQVITERGSVESAENVDICCEVHSHGAGSVILWIIPEGTYVTPNPDWKQEDHPGEEPPDLLLRLDSSAREEELMRQQITCHSSEALLISAKNDYETAKIAKDEYEHGRYEQQKLAIQSKIFVARENLRNAEDTLRFSREQLVMGYVTELQVQADRFRVEKAKKDLLEAETNLRVLQEYTGQRMLGDLESAITTAEAKLRSREHIHQLLLERLEKIQEQIDRCTIRAPQAGQVVYANVTDHHGHSEIVIEAGTVVHERQVIIRLPDPKNMQVRAKINEGRIALVKEGMPATCRLDAFPNLRLHGTVEKVKQYPLPSSWFGGGVKEYEAVVRINDFPETLQLRPGMTAEVKICVEQSDDVLLAPVEAVLDRGGRHYCVLREGQAFKAQEVMPASANDKEVAIEKGLEEGQQVVLDAALYRDQIALPELPPRPSAPEDRPKPQETAGE